MLLNVMNSKRLLRGGNEDAGTDRLPIRNERTPSSAYMLASFPQ